MPVPYLGNALNGWTRKIPVKLVTKEVVNHLVQETHQDLILDMNIQPVPPAVINRKPEEERTWKWFSIIVKKGPLLKTNDLIIVDGTQYKIQSVINWSESGFQKYEAIEDFT